MSYETVWDQIRAEASAKAVMALYPSASNRGYVFEKMWDIIIKLGYCPRFARDEWRHYCGCVNTAMVTEIADIAAYMKGRKVMGKGAGGASDITLRRVGDGGEWAFVSCKFFGRDSKRYITEYDIGPINSAVGAQSATFGPVSNIKIYLAVNNGAAVRKVMAAATASNNHLRDAVTDILDLAELEACFAHLKRDIADVPFSNIAARFGAAKPPLALRFHQELIVRCQMVAIAAGETNLLLGAKPRSGKTFCVGGLVAALARERAGRNINAMVVTPAPTETAAQFVDDLFRRHADFAHTTITHISGGADLSKFAPGPGANIVVISKQLLDDYVGAAANAALKSLALDLLVFDESHFHGTTAMAKDIFDTYTTPTTVKLYMTATFGKPARTWNFADIGKCFWDVQDERMCKTRDVEGLAARHGPAVHDIIASAVSADAALGVYDAMPDIHILTSTMDPAETERIRATIGGTGQGLSFGALFALSANKKAFKYPAEVAAFLENISGHGAVKSPVRRERSIFERTKRLSADHGSRTGLRHAEFTTQLWFVGYGQGMRVNDVCTCLAAMMAQNHGLVEYDVYIANAATADDSRKVKENIRLREEKAHSAGKAGLIVLAGNQLTLGVTLPLVDAVMLLHDSSAGDRVIQMMYRCMTEALGDEHTRRLNPAPKKLGFVVDMCAARVARTLFAFPLDGAPLLNVEQKLTYLIERRLFNVDYDQFSAKTNVSGPVERLMDAWRFDSVSQMMFDINQLDNYVITLDAVDQAAVNRFAAGGAKARSSGEKIAFDTDHRIDLPSGVSRTVVPDAEPVGDGDGDTPPTEQTKADINFAREMLPSAIVLGAILTIGQSTNNLLEILESVRDDPELAGVFDSHGFVLWDHRNAIRLIAAIVGKYIKPDDMVYSIAIRIKMQMRSLADNPVELMTFIDSQLKPKQKEKQELGEVFTPMPVINEMLDALAAAHAATAGGADIFADPALTWMDPAAGMGNFPAAVYMRLMRGLEPAVPDPDARKQHVLENMLFMNEINPKNAAVSRRIFDPAGALSLNIVERDALALNTEAEWGRATFDVVMGNPPYNIGGIRSHTGKKLGDTNKTVWPAFVHAALDWTAPGGRLVFITPLSWLKTSHACHAPLLERHVEWLTLWDNTMSIDKINAKIPISSYVLHNIVNDAHSPTIVHSVLKRRKIDSVITLYLDPVHTVPIAMQSALFKLLRFITENTASLEIHTKVVKATGTKLALPTTVLSADELWAVDTFTEKDGILVKRAAVLHPHAATPKLIIANKAAFTGAFVDDGRLGLCGTDKAYVLGDNLELVRKTLGFGICAAAAHFTKYRQDFLDKAAFEYIPDLRKLGVEDMSEQELYHRIGLTETEIAEVGAVRRVV